MMMNVSKQTAIRDLTTCTIVDRRCKTVVCTDTGDYWPSVQKCAEAIGVTPYSIYQVCNKKTKTCKGLHFTYEENVNETRTMLSQRVSDLNAEKKNLNNENKNLRDQLNAKDVLRLTVKELFEEKEMLEKAKAEVARLEASVAEMEKNLALMV